MTTKFRVLISDSMSKQAAQTLSASSAVSVDDRGGLSADELVSVIGEYNALLVRSRTKVTEEVIAAGASLQLIGRAGIGVDNIDIAAASRRGILVENAPNGNSITTAEHAICLLASLARNIPTATASMKAGKWEKKILGGRELCGKSIGVIGLGNIGRIAADRARGLKMKLLGYDPFIKRDDAARLGVELLELDELLARADFITIHTPLTDQTRGLLDAAAFAKCKPGLLLVNAARGGIVDEKALLAALEAGQVAGAALDVFEKEPPAKDHPLVLHPRVICTPHLGASTTEAQDKVAVEIATQIVAFAERGDVINAINAVAIPPDEREQIAPWLELATSVGALAAQRSAIGKIDAVEIEIAGVPSGRAATTAVLVGLMKNLSDQAVNSVNAGVLAKDLGITIADNSRDRDRQFESSISIRVRAGENSGFVRGALIGIGSQQLARVVQLDEALVEAPATGNLLVLKNHDRPGVIGRVGTLLGEGAINVNSLHVGQDTTGDLAVAVWNLATPADAEMVAKVRALENVLTADAISL